MNAYQFSLQDSLPRRNPELPALASFNSYFKEKPYLTRHFPEAGVDCRIMPFCDHVDAREWNMGEGFIRVCNLSIFEVLTLICFANPMDLTCATTWISEGQINMGPEHNHLYAHFKYGPHSLANLICYELNCPRMDADEMLLTAKSDFQNFLYGNYHTDFDNKRVNAKCNLLMETAGASFRSDWQIQPTMDELLYFMEPYFADDNLPLVNYTRYHGHVGLDWTDIDSKEALRDRLLQKGLRVEQGHQSIRKLCFS